MRRIIVYLIPVVLLFIHTPVSAAADTLSHIADRENFIPVFIIFAGTIIVLGSHVLILKNRFYQTKIKLQRSEQWFTLFFENSENGIILFTIDDDYRPVRIADINTTACRLYGYTKQELLEKDTKTYVDQQNLDYVLGNTTQLKEGKEVKIEREYVNAHNITYYFEIRCRIIEIAKKKKLLVIVIDKTSQKKTEEELKKTALKFQTVAEHTAEWEFWTDSVNELIYNSSACERITGFTTEDFFFNPALMTSIVYEEDISIWKKHLSDRYDRDKKHEPVVFRIVRKDGSIAWIEHSCKLIFDDNGAFLGHRGSNRDITRRKETEFRLRKSNRDKEILLQEIHHRVKNNLQIISSLLTMQSAAVDNRNVQAHLQNTANRVHSMGILHQLLYQTDEADQLDFFRYTSLLIEHLQGSYSIPSDTISFAVNIPSVLFSPETALPCGLIMNELITNSIKYAFPDNMKGYIGIRLTKIDSHFYELCVYDTGIGLPLFHDLHQTGGLGLSLVQMLAEQLGSEVNIYRSEGTVFRFKFTVPKNEHQWTSTTYAHMKT